MSFIVAAAITVGGTLLAGKIQSNRQKDPKAAIGAGTAPSIQPGPEAEITPIEGSQVQEFGEFTYDDPAKAKVDTGQQLVSYLTNQGISPRDFGILGGALGAKEGKEISIEELIKQFEKEGGLLDLDAEQLEEFKKSLYAGTPDKTGIQDLIPEVDLSPESTVATYDSTSPTPMKVETTTPEIVPLPTDPSFFDKTKTFAMENPEIFNAGLGALTNVLSALLFDSPEPKGTNVMTQTLPAGGLGAKRDYLKSIRPIMGTAFAGSRGFKDGGVLNRPMFTPMLEGGDIEGPGGPKDDLIPVMASDGEFMLSNAAVKHMGKGNHQKGIAMLEAFNKQGNRKYG